MVSCVLCCLVCCLVVCVGVWCEGVLFLFFSILFFLFLALSPSFLFFPYSVLSSSFSSLFNSRQQTLCKVLINKSEYPSLLLSPPSSLPLRFQRSSYFSFSFSLSLSFTLSFQPLCKEPINQQASRRSDVIWRTLVRG